jgi:hypothetical protein
MFFTALSREHSSIRDRDGEEEAWGILQAFFTLHFSS